MLLSDEVYKDFLYSAGSSRRRGSGRPVSVVRVFSFSAYGMTGGASGSHSDRQNVAEILKVHDALVSPVLAVRRIGGLELGDDTIEFRRVSARRNLRSAS
jgi:aspartate/methionine/tyrosine aminotransferase